MRRQDLHLTQFLRPPAGAREDQSAGEDSVFDATATSVGSGLDEASALRAQLAALNEKIKVLEAKQPAHPSPDVVAAAAAESANVVGPDEVVDPAGAERATEASEPAISPTPPIPEEPVVPSVAENLTVRASDGNMILGLEDVDGVLTQCDGRPPSSDVDVDQEEELVDLDDPVAPCYASSENSDRAEFEEQEEEELVNLEVEDRPTGGASTPYHQDSDPSDSEDE